MKITLMAALSIHQALIKPALSPSGWNLQWINITNPANFTFHHSIAIQINSIVLFEKNAQIIMTTHYHPYMEQNWVSLNIHPKFNRMKDENIYTTEPVQLEWDDKNRGRFFITMNEQEVAEMIIGRDGNDVIVYHTEVLPEAEGKGLAKKLLESMVAYVRENNLQVVVLCPFVFAQFRRHPETYADIWKNKPGQ
jgi:predicted GNAT family acetyltransferase